MFYGWKDVNDEHVFYVLQALKDLFASQEKWLDWPQAIDQNDIEVDPLDETAVRWNLMGASFKIACEKYKTPLANYIDCAIREFLNDLSDDAQIKTVLSYKDEYSLICLALDHLSK